VTRDVEKLLYYFDINVNGNILLTNHKGASVSMFLWFLEGFLCCYIVGCSSIRSDW